MKTAKTALKAKKVNDVSTHSKALEHVASGAALQAVKKNVKSLSGSKAAVDDLINKSTISNLKAEKKTQTTPRGNHNKALSSVAAEAKAFRKESTRQTTKTTNKPFNYMRAAKISAAIVAAGLCFAFQSVLKSYHAALKKQEQLTRLFNNPNARVAAGDQGKSILKKLSDAKKNVKKTPKKAVKASPKKVVKKSANEETLEKILKLLEEQKRVKTDMEAQQIV